MQEDTMKEELTKADIIFIMGGDTQKQNTFLEKYNLKETIKTSKGIVIGISAGAILYCGTHGLMAPVPVEKVRECQDSFLEIMRNSHKDVIDLLGSGKIDDNATAVIEKVMADVAGQYKK